ncbi:nucleotidyl transferase AbiEii/AbiGii toxin family protein [Sphingobacterium lumbrici]|uniref:nucleotidyl transferase AbiEii/AbiGii toxin family protein n=1 Tax=Sphingobacterium lumbrici TaxID=2559600 RepID=UPI00112D7505|nr:nucleotidyl transferase AbiEii/AbiGii toxin family protein [Sphingobacterium lumbrici]
MKLHENKELFQDAVIATSQQLSIKEIYIEKDYWVTFALFNIFKNDIGKETVFKGGTALSKCFGMIQRFSEDIDLVVLRNESETGNQLKTKIKKISKYVSDVLPEIDIDGITNKVGMIRKTAHNYPRTFTGHFGQVRDIIIVESTWLGNFEPYTTASVSSFIYEMMLQNNQQTLIDDYGINPFEVLVLNPKRTLCEKIMSLVRFSQTQEPITDLRNKIRHTYDIHLMLKDENLKSFFQSDEFKTMLLRVANDDITSFKNNNEWLANHPTTAIIFSDTTDTWNKIKDAYTKSFSELVFGELPPEKDILKTLTAVSDRLKTIEWNIKP